jgi:elongator complex protein 1
MLQFTEEHQAEGKSLQIELVGFQDELKLALDEVWTKEEKSADDENPPAKVQDLIEKVPKPEIVEPKWRVRLWEVKESHSLLAPWSLYSTT